MLVKTSSKVQKCKKKIKFFLNADFSGARGWGRGDRGQYLMGTELQFRKRKVLEAVGVGGSAA